MESPKSPSKNKGFTEYKWMLRIVTIFIVILLLGFYLESDNGKRHNVSTASYYTVVVDCGSTGTRVNVYEWMVGGVTNGNLPILLHSYPDSSTHSSLWKTSCQYHCMQTEPGLEKFINDSLGVRASLEPLIVWAEQMVPQERHTETPIFVLATAGLRRVESEDAKWVLENVEAIVKDHSFMHRKGWIRVLTGSEEAYYGWVALNYKMGIFHMYPGSSPLGLLDLGGSSLQIVMETGGRVDELHMMRSKLNSIEHQIITYSLPAFGLNEAFDRTVDMLISNQSVERTGFNFELRHPCLKSTYMLNYSCYSCSGLDVNNLKNHSQAQKHEIPSLHLVGEPDWEQCRELAIAASLNSSNSNLLHPTVGKNCQDSSSSGIGTINLAAVVHPTKRFHALSGFFFVYNKLNLSPRANLTKVWESGEQICSKLWAGSNNISDNPIYAGQFCFRVAYMASLIEYALCLRDVDITFGPGDVSWTLGAALVEGKFLWLNTTNSNAQTIISTLKNVKVTSSPTFLFAILLFLLVIVYCSQIKLPMPSRRPSAAGSSFPSYIHAAVVNAGTVEDNFHWSWPPSELVWECYSLVLL